MLGLRLPRGVRPQLVLGPNPGSSFMSLGCGPSHRIGDGVLECIKVLVGLTLELFFGEQLGLLLFFCVSRCPGLGVMSIGLSTCRSRIGDPILLLLGLLLWL